MLPPTPPPKASRRDWISLAVLALPCMVYAMDLTVLNLALPRISEDLKPTTSQLLWIVDIYGFFVAAFLITMGNIGDRFGRRRVLLVGAAAFTLASIIAAFAKDATTLIVMRAVLGIAGATLAPSTLSLIRNIFHDPGQRQLAIGLWITAFSVGSTLGPLVGGVVLAFFDWGAIFLVAVPVMVALLVLGPWLLPEYRDPAARPIDAASVGLSLAATLVTIHGIKALAEDGLAWRAVVEVAAGLALVAVFLARQRRLDHPLLDTALFGQPRFAAAVATYGLACLAMIGVYLFVTQYLQLVLGLTPLQTGIAIVPGSLVFVVGSLAAPRLAARYGVVTVIVRGLLVAGLGLALVALARPDQGIAAVIAGTAIMGLGMAPVFTLGNDIILTAAPPERAGAASALSETSAEFSSALGIAVVGSLGMAAYRLGLSPDLLAHLAPAARAEALATVSATFAAAAQLPAAEQAAIVDAARTAFTSALRVAALAGALIVVVTAAVVGRQLRRGPPSVPPVPSVPSATHEARAPQAPQAPR